MELAIMVKASLPVRKHAPPRFDVAKHCARWKWQQFSSARDALSLAFADSLEPLL